MRNRVLILAAAALALASAAPAGATPPHCPPGHAKKGECRPAAGGPPGHARYERVDDYDRYGLKRPRDGYYYGELDGEIYLILAATQEIVEAVGAVAVLLNR